MPMDKEKFFSATRRGTATYTMPDGDLVEIRSLSIGEREAVARMSEDGKYAEALCNVVAWAVDGLSEDDLDQIRNMDAGHLRAISNAVLALSGLSSVAVDEAKNV